MAVKISCRPGAGWILGVRESGVGKSKEWKEWDDIKKISRVLQAEISFSCVRRGLELEVA